MKSTMVMVMLDKAYLLGPFFFLFFFNDRKGYFLSKTSLRKDTQIDYKVKQTALFEL